MEDENYFPNLVRVEKALGGNKFNVDPKNGTLSNIEKELFEFCVSKITLKNNLGQDINYYNKSGGRAEIIEGLPKAIYIYETHKHPYSNQLKRD